MQLDYRLITALKRRIIQILIKGKLSKVSVYRLEKSAIPSTKLGVHSSEKYLEIFDPRAQETQGHYFNQRMVRAVSNVIVEPKQGLIYSQKGELIQESTCWPISDVRNSFPWNPRPNNLQNIGEAIALSSASYYHWLIEDLPPVLSSIKHCTKPTILILDEAPSYSKDFISLLNLTTIKTKKPVMVRKLILTEKCEDVGWPHPSDIAALEAFKSQVTEKSNNVPELIYVSRRSSKRSPANENEIENIFFDLGFTVIQTEKMSLLDQIQIFSSAKFIAGVHGAGLSNMVWSNPKAIILDIANENYWTECFHRLAFLKQHIYESFVYDGAVDSKVNLRDLKNKILEIRQRYKV